MLATSKDVKAHRHTSCLPRQECHTAMVPIMFATCVSHVLDAYMSIYQGLTHVHVSVQRKHLLWDVPGGSSNENGSG